MLALVVTGLYNNGHLMLADDGSVLLTVGGENEVPLGVDFPTSGPALLWVKEDTALGEGLAINCHCASDFGCLKLIRTAPRGAE